MFETRTESTSIRAPIASLLMHVTAVTTVFAAPYLISGEIRPNLRVTATIFAPSRRSEAPKQQKHREFHVRTPKPLEPGPTSPPPPEIPGPNTKPPEKTGNVGRQIERYGAIGATAGKHLEFAIVTDPAFYVSVLRQYQVKIALTENPPEPGSPAVILNLDTGALEEEPVGNTAQVRIIDRAEEVPAIARGLQRARALLGRGVRVYALYPGHLVLALQGRIAEELAQRGRDPKAVAQVRFQYIAAGPAGFDIQLLDIQTN